eukprot:scaffold826_cov335-Pavlova_lutheri.AAC.8
MDGASSSGDVAGSIDSLPLHRARFACSPVDPSIHGARTNPSCRAFPLPVNFIARFSAMHRRLPVELGDGAESQSQSDPGHRFVPQNHGHHGEEQSHERGIIRRRFQRLDGTVLPVLWMCEQGQLVFRVGTTPRGLVLPPFLAYPRHAFGSCIVPCVATHLLFPPFFGRYDGFGLPRIGCQCHVLLGFHGAAMDVNDGRWFLRVERPVHSNPKP